MPNEKRICLELYECLKLHRSIECAEAYKANAASEKVRWFTHESARISMAAKLDLMYWDDTPEGYDYWDDVFAYLITHKL